MTSFISAPPAQVPTSNNINDDSEEINFLDFVDVVLDGKWLIAGIAALSIVLGGAYAILATPIYEANTLIQVEDGKAGGLGNLLGDVSGMFDIKSPASAEIEILRSRFVIGQAVSNLKLDVEVTPKYIPVVGRWLSQRTSELSDPGFLGLSGYVYGAEQLSVAAFNVPQSAEAERFLVRVTHDGYMLLSEDGEELGRGRLNANLKFLRDSREGNLLISNVKAKAGAEFYLTAFSKLDVTENLQQDLYIGEQGKQSGVIRTSLQGKDPVQISSILNEIGALYVRQNVERKAAEAEKSLNFLNTQLPQLKRELESSEAKFNQFRNQNATFDLSNEAKVLLDQAVALKVKLLELQQKREELTTRFTSAHPSVQVVDAQIKEIGGQISTLEARGKAFPNIEQDMLRLTRDVKVNNELYTSLLNSFQQLRLVKEGKVGNVRMVDVAAIPERPIKPRRALSVLIATAIGVVFGILLSFVRNSLRPGLREPYEIESRTGLTVFATVPHSEPQTQHARDMQGKKAGNHVLAVLAPHDPVVESLRSLRTALQFAMLDTDNNIVLFTGATPGIGKSFTSVNFAAVIGAANKRILLIDADLRRGHLNQYFGQIRDGGLSEVVSGSLQLSSAIRTSVAPNVDFLSTGVLPPNPAELLMSSAARRMLSEASKNYDLVIIDTPPVLAASDTAILAPLVGAVFLIARAEVSTLGELQETTKRLSQIGVKPRGVIFNDVNISRRRYGFGYRYGNYRYTDYKYS